MPEFVGLLQLKIDGQIRNSPKVSRLTIDNASFKPIASASVASVDSVSENEAINEEKQSHSDQSSLPRPQ